MAAVGVPLRTLQEWFGHRDSKTTEIYADYQPLSAVLVKSPSGSSLRLCWDYRSGRSPGAPAGASALSET